MSKLTVTNEDDKEIEFTNDGDFYVTVDSYEVDFEKVNKLEDVINILKAMNLHVYDDGSDKLEPIRRMLKKRE